MHCFCCWFSDFASPQAGVVTSLKSIGSNAGAEFAKLACFAATWPLQSSERPVTIGIFWLCECHMNIAIGLAYHNSRIPRILKRTDQNLGHVTKYRINVTAVPTKAGEQVPQINNSSSMENNVFTTIRSSSLIMVPSNAQNRFHEKSQMKRRLTLTPSLFAEDV